MLIDISLPLSLAFIMFSSRLELIFTDCGRVPPMPWAVLTGLIIQIITVPVVAFVLLQLFNLPPVMTFGAMLLAFCPSGVTSNVLAKIGGGNVALSITLTAIVSLLSVLTVPLLTGWAAARFLGADTPHINVTGIAVAMFAITAVPVLLGLLLRFVATGLADQIERGVSARGVVLFVLVVLAALASNWALFMANIATLGPMLFLLNILLLTIGGGVARALGLTGGDALCISVEMGVQNAALGITVAGLIAQAVGISEYAIPAVVSGITMYIVTLPGIPFDAAHLQSNLKALP
ncbi:MAG: bile acid:sodium symporter [Rhodobacterales bacterium]|nr:MAG: bile acid:sodium symporter [Rhodobacterales bacterium]